MVHYKLKRHTSGVFAHAEYRNSNDMIKNSFVIVKMNVLVGNNIEKVFLGNKKSEFKTTLVCFAFFTFTYEVMFSMFVLQHERCHSIEKPNGPQLSIHVMMAK